MKKIRIIILSLLLFILLSPNAKAVEDEFFKEQYDALGVDELLESLDDETLEMLEELGITEIDFDNLFNVTPKRIFSLILDIIKGKADSPIKIFATVSIIIILFSIIESLFPKGEKLRLTISSVSILICTSILAKPIFESVSRGMSVIEASSNLMLVFVPVFVAVVSVSGNPMTAMSYNSLILAAAQTVSQTANYFIKPCVAIFFALGLTSSVSGEFNFRQLANEIKKNATMVLSFISTMFFSFLSLKGALANASDSMGAKGIKFILSSFIPVVGGAISEGYSSLVGSLSLLKGVIGGFGISAVALINIPVIIELLIWTVVLRFASAISAALKVDSLSDLFKIIADSTTLINVVVILNCVILIISTGLLMLLKGGGT